MQASDAPRAPTHFSLLVPTAANDGSAAALGTSTARPKLFGRRVRMVSDYAPPWAREFCLLLLMLLCAVPVGRPDACAIRIRPDARPFAARHLPPNPRPRTSLSHSCLSLRSRSVFTTHSSAECHAPLPFMPPSCTNTAPPPPSVPLRLALLSPPPACPLGLICSTAPPAPLLSGSSGLSRRKAMAPAYPDVRKGSCQNGLSFKRSHQCSPIVPHRSPACPRIAHILHPKCASC